MNNEEPFVMVVSPHPDDAEIGMGGTIAALQSAGIKVALIDLTNGEPTPFGSPEKRKSESAAASAILKISARETLSIKNREIFDTVENRKALAAMMRRYKPQLLFLPYWEDGHPDHVNACALAIAARFYAKLSNSDIEGEPFYPRKMVHFFSTHIRPKVNPSLLFDVSAHFETKINAVAAYRSQFTDNPNNVGILDALRVEGAYWGAQIGAAFAEPFISREHIGIRSAKALLEI